VGTDDKYLHIGHADNIGYDDFRKLTKSASHPRGLDPDQLESALHLPSTRDLEHPLIRKFLAFKKKTGISDFNIDNFGLWTHPHTGEKHIVLRDAGFDRSTKDIYMGGDYKNPTHMLDRFIKYVKISKKKKQAEKFRKSLKEGLMLHERNWEKWWMKRAIKKAIKNKSAHEKAKSKVNNLYKE
jgi:hypothetical protein